MPFVRRVSLAATATTSGGNAQTWHTGVVNGYISAIRLVNGATQPSTACHYTITGEQSGISLLNCTATASGNITYYPRGRAVDTSNTIYGEAAGASAPTPVLIPIADERIRVVGTSMGTVSGNGGRQFTIHFYVDGAAAGT